MIVRELIARLGLSIDEAAFARADMLIAGIGKGVMAFGTAAVAAVAIGVTALSKSAADAADHIKKLSQSTGVDSIALQEFAYSTDLADVNIDELAHGLQHLAKTGVKDVRAEVLRLADQFQKMPDNGAKVELAMDKFGRAGARLIPWLNAGAKGIADLAQEAHDLGVIFDTEAQESAEQFNDNVKRLSYSFAGLRNVIGAVVLPVLNRFVIRSIEFIKYMRANWTPMMHTVELTLRTLAFVLGGIVLAALTMNTAATISAVGWYTALGVQAAAAAVRAAIAWAAAAAPVIGLAAVFTSLLLILEDINGFLNGENSLTGELLKRFATLIDEFTKKGEKPWLINILEYAGWLLSDAVSKVILIKKLISEIPNVFSATADFVSAGGGVTGAIAAGTRLFGSGATPAASAATAAAARPVITGTPSFSVGDITINASPGMNPQDVANVVVRTMDAHFDAKMREGDAKSPQ